MSYKSLEIWRLADEISIDIHLMTMNDLPKFEMFETGSQVRRSSKSIKSNIVEGYGRRIYPKEYFHHLQTDLSREVLYKHCDQRLELMFNNGAVEEVEKLLQESLGRYIYDNNISILGNPLPKKKASGVAGGELFVWL